MKKIILSTLFLASIGFFFTSCEKEEELVVFDEANIKAGTLAVSNANIVLQKADDANQAVTFTLGKADFGFDAGINYTLQIAKKGTDFKSPSETSLANVLEKSFTVKELNTILINAGAIAGSPNDFEARVIASIGEKQKTAISNVVSFSGTPYFALLNYPKIYVPGDYQGWAPDKDNVEVLASIDFDFENYEGYINFVNATTKFKFTPEPNWTSDWGDEMASGNTGKLKEKGSDLIINEAGYYYFKVNTASLKYSIVKTSWGVLGDATPTGWDKDTDMTYDVTNKTWSVKLDLVGGKKIKFRANDAWDINFGDGTDDDPKADGFTNYGGKDILISENGNYTITLNLSNPGNYTYSIKKN